jgi:hypothetical protein
MYRHRLLFFQHPASGDSRYPAVVVPLFASELGAIGFNGKSLHSPSGSRYGLALSFPTMPCRATAHTASIFIYSNLNAFSLITFNNSCAFDLLHREFPEIVARLCLLCTSGKCGRAGLEGITLFAGLTSWRSKVQRKRDANSASLFRLSLRERMWGGSRTRGR